MVIESVGWSWLASGWGAVSFTSGPFRESSSNCGYSDQGLNGANKCLESGLWFTAGATDGSLVLRPHSNFLWFRSSHTAKTSFPLHGFDRHQKEGVVDFCECCFSAVVIVVCQNAVRSRTSGRRSSCPRRLEVVQLFWWWRWQRG